MALEQEEYEPCYGCEKPVPHSAVDNWRILPPEPGDIEDQGTVLFCDKCLQWAKDMEVLHEPR